MIIILPVVGTDMAALRQLARAAAEEVRAEALWASIGEDHYGGCGGKGGGQRGEEDGRELHDCCWCMRVLSVVGLAVFLGMWVDIG